MNIDELKSKIQFEQRPMQNGLVQIRARLHLAVTYVIDPVACEISDLEERVQERLVERICRMLYDDQREALHGAIIEFLAANPMDSRAIVAARDKLLTRAMYQGPNVRP